MCAHRSADTTIVRQRVWPHAWASRVFECAAACVLARRTLSISRSERDRDSLRQSLSMRGIRMYCNVLYVYVAVCGTRYGRNFGLCVCVLRCVRLALLCLCGRIDAYGFIYLHEGRRIHVQLQVQRLL